ncbi:MAG: tRNA uridine-5-carboxymethylaminomethyl(34) synthesis GTPase MnmE [Bacteroidales bacterium]|nr:tRNA uridine-5-carboxymethylaminomethyl(34) synthesis GTPase MnmE [Bacteroidales bacterium]
MQHQSTTICAISTPAGNGAIALIRLSGPEALNVIAQIFTPASNNTDIKPNTITYGTIKDSEIVLDEVLVSFFKAPHSYTGEDIIEISCHGSLYIQQKLLQLLVNRGAVLAKSGEFTMRAFVNGKLDLSQSEAVADLIASSSEASHRLAINQMKGGVSNQILILRSKLLDFTSLLELELDFSEEDLEFADRNELRKLIMEVDLLLEKLVDSFSTGNAIKNGIPVSIVGKTNVGKSTLLNLLLNEEKAIVSEIPGTTRDVIEDTISLHGILFRFIDTAGLRETRDVIETMGIERTLEKVKQARIILILADIKENIEEIKKQVEQINISADQDIIVILNKVDTLDDKEINQKIQQLTNDISYPILSISAKKHQHIDQLITQLLQSAHLQSIEDNDVVITNVRHYEALKNASEAIKRALIGMDSGISSDFIAMDIRQTLHFLGEITGEITTDEVLGNIFAKFCIGK